MNWEGNARDGRVRLNAPRTMMAAIVAPFAAHDVHQFSQIDAHTLTRMPCSSTENAGSRRDHKQGDGARSFFYRPEAKTAAARLARPRHVDSDLVITIQEFR